MEDEISKIILCNKMKYMIADYKEDWEQRNTRRMAEFL